MYYCNITDDQTNTTTITPEQAIKEEKIELPVNGVAIKQIDANFPQAFKSVHVPNVESTDPKVDIRYDL